MSDSAKKPCPCEGSSLNRFVQPTILAILKQGPDHGYSILQKISQNGLFAGDMPDAAGVYRALREMESRGLITSELSSESKAGLGKRVFTITKEGMLCCTSWLWTLKNYQTGLGTVISMLEQPPAK